MHTNFFDHVDVKPENINILDGNAEDLDAECEAYEEKMRAAGGVDLFLGGIGTDGHFAFNEPGSSLSSRTRIKTLAYDTIVDNARFFGGDVSKVPKQALTVGVATIMDAREVLILVNGKHKAYALKKALASVSHLWTISAIQMHQRAVIVCDDDATLELKVKTVRYFKQLEEQNLLDASKP
jgi:glucosamine-6-phosphate deaminase